MLAIRFTFPGHRYHATPWDNHVNEGVVEWPPAPWRLHRALISVWHRKAPDIQENAVRRIVEALAAESPLYALPPTVPSHTRHYMPPFKGNTTKVFDAFLHISKDAVLDMIWPDTELATSDREALATLLGRLSYLGRAESWVLASLVNQPNEANTKPVCTGAEDGEIVRVLSPVSTSDYDSWQLAAFDEQLTRTLQEKLAKKKKGALTKGDHKKAEEQARKKIPSDLFAALHLDTSDIRKAAWSQAPGSHWVDYRRPQRTTVDASFPTPDKSKNLPTVARFAVISKLAPPLTKGIQFAEVVRKTLLKLSDGHLVFRGRDQQDNQPAKGHSHVHVFPESNDVTGRITHLSIVAKSGFDEKAVLTLHSIRRLFAGSAFEAQVALVGVGNPDDFVSEGVGGAVILATSTQWVSRTPFVSTRHPKWRGRDEQGNRLPRLDEHGRQIGSAEHDLCRLLQSSGFPMPISTRPVASTVLKGTTEWRHFTRWRKHGGGRNSGNRGYGFEIEFAVPVKGPIAVGYGAHFGLGLFAPTGSYE